jgi:hypothetical protein
LHRYFFAHIFQPLLGITIKVGPDLTLESIKEPRSYQGPERQTMRDSPPLLSQDPG